MCGELGCRNPRGSQPSQTLNIPLHAHVCVTTLSTYTQASIWTHRHVCLHTLMYVWTRTCTHTYNTHTCTHTCTHTHTTHTHTYNTHTHTQHTHTHTHTYNAHTHTHTHMTKLRVILTGLMHWPVRCTDQYHNTYSYMSEHLGQTI